MHARHAVLALLLSALSLAGCGDDDQVDPSNPDASAATDVSKDATRSDGGKDAAREAAEDAGRDLEDSPGDAGHE